MGLVIDEVAFEIEMIVAVGVAFVIDRLPETDHIAFSVAYIASRCQPVAKASHAAHKLPADLTSEYGAESVRTQAYRLVADVDPTLEQQSSTFLSESK